MKNSKIFHLSHTDLDGYSCQFLTKHLPNETSFYNANYGAEVKQTLEAMLEDITKCSGEILLLVSDLNLNMEEAKWLDEQVNKLRSGARSIELVLLDHHISGEECAKKFKWYYLDVARCATKIVYDWLGENFSFDEPSWMRPFVDVVNAVDLWKIEESENFEYGKVCMRLISEARELNKIMFASEDSLYKLHLLAGSLEYLGVKNAPILLDDNIHRLKKSFFVRDENNTLDNLSSSYIVELFGRDMSQKTIYYRGYKGYLGYMVGNSSILGNAFLKRYSEYDFYVDVSSKGTMSLRADNRVSVALISKEWCGGGGHANAAGGRIVGFKEQFRYDKVKEQIEKLIAQRESLAGELASRE